MTTASAPGENFEVRQTSATEDWHPDRKVYLVIDHYFCLWELSWLPFSCVLGRKTMSKLPIPTSIRIFLTHSTNILRSVKVHSSWQGQTSASWWYHCSLQLWADNWESGALYTWLRIWWSVCICKWSVGGFPARLDAKASSPSGSYKMAGQWFALPKLFKASKNEGYQVVRSDDEVLQFKNEQVRFALNPVSYDWN